ncbi:cupin domain-containing protein [Fundicoccus culcitae]|uniref:Cupin domain-containing protein n=1 Tax=Fundicoccus culcitae TaxID=2969821 RepID=A0ABY5P3C2_9LACT|nr:cupin domain-containing protein [Fundicoccus culcitae]UUX33106.1 cupin domain-containing protein [Fundicoccus culcitae]
MNKYPQVQAVFFEDDGKIPNNPKLPLLIYSQVFDASDVIAAIFSENNWTKAWRNGIFNYHHYHSTSHEVLGVEAGWAEVQLGGGANGIVFTLKAGDMVVIPAGVGHKRLNASTDFTVIGAYPDGHEYDLLTGKADERPENLHRIAQLPLPTTDPVFGVDGVLFDYWVY